MKNVSNARLPNEQGIRRHVTSTRLAPAAGSFKSSVVEIKSINLLLTVLIDSLIYFDQFISINSTIQWQTVIPYHVMA
jgi:hypothetical protein